MLNRFNHACTKRMKEQRRKSESKQKQKIKQNYEYVIINNNKWTIHFTKCLPNDINRFCFFPFLHVLCAHFVLSWINVMEMPNLDFEVHSFVFVLFFVLSAFQLQSICMKWNFELKQKNKRITIRHFVSLHLVSCIPSKGKEKNLEF